MKVASRISLLAVGLMAGGVAGYWAPGVVGQGQPGPTAVRTDPASFRDVVKKVLPAVVSIESKVNVRKVVDENRSRRPPRFNSEDLPERQLERQPNEIVPPDGNVGFGSGFIVDSQGIILTNYHVVRGADQVEVTLSDRRKFTSKDIKFDERTDIAIVRIDTKGSPLPHLELGDSTATEIGDRVLAVGAPFGLTGSVTHGIVSAKSRDVGLNRYDDFLQTDAAINPGNSGGPLVNIDGKVIGLNSAIKSRSGGFQGVGLAISSNFAKRIMNQLIKDGVVKRGYLGIEMVRDITPEVAERLGLKTQGVVVSRVMENTPAAKSGLKADDVIVSIIGRPVKERRELQRIVAELPIGEPVDVEILRNGKPSKLKLTLEEEPKDYGVSQRQPLRVPRTAESTVSEKAGLELIDLTSDLAEALGTNPGGAVITRVDPGSPASEAGLSRGMVIQKVNKKAVKSAEDAKDAVEKSDAETGALVQVYGQRTGVEIVLLKMK